MERPMKTEQGREFGLVLARRFAGRPSRGTWQEVREAGHTYMYEAGTCVHVRDNWRRAPRPGHQIHQVEIKNKRKRRLRVQD